MKTAPHTAFFIHKEPFGFKPLKVGINQCWAGIWFGGWEPFVPVRKTKLELGLIFGTGSITTN
jgi:hypothetical protein